LQAKREKSTDAGIADVCIGTSAAPYYFPPYNFRTTVDFNLADGGLAANNPVSYLYVAIGVVNVAKWI
jgi:patatin-like phospholipase/acyl hydrolase